MSTLISPGVSVTVNNEGFYGASGPGTVPLVIIATATNKTSPSISGAIAPYTTPATAGKLFLATSQREIIQSFGNPTFAEYQGTMVHGDELNEYGLHAVYSYLGVNNRCYVLRADLDLNQLQPSVTAPSGPPVAGTYWFDVKSTQWGLYQSNGSVLAGNAWTSKSVSVVPYNQISAGTGAPLSSFGSAGDFAVSPWTVNNVFYEKIDSNWYQLGTQAWAAHHPSIVIGANNPPNINVGDSFSINGVTVTPSAPGAIADVISAINTAAIQNITATISANAILITNTAGQSITFADVSGYPLTVMGFASGTVKGVSEITTNTVSWPTGSVPGDVWIKGNPTNRGASWSVKLYDGTAGRWLTLTAPFFPFDATLTDSDLGKDAGARLALGSPTVGTVYVGFDSVNSIRQLRRWSGLVWETLSYEADFVAPTTSPVDGTLWYNPSPTIDIMYGDGEQWVGYRRQFPNTDPAGVQISGSAPTYQSDGTPLAENDLWVDSSDLENYPMIYRWDSANRRWRLVDNTDHTSPFGIVFGDARADSGTDFTGISNSGTYAFNSVAVEDMALSDFVDPDAPLPEYHPAGTLLFNTRFTTCNVKVWRNNYLGAGLNAFDENTDFTITPYAIGTNPYVAFPALASAGRWVDASGLTDTHATPYMMRKAQRHMVVKALKATIESNEDIRSEMVFFNLVACPGYPELITDMLTLNVDQKEVAFIVGDTPIRLASNATDIQAWATNSKNVASDGEDGLVTSYDYAGVYYPWGLGSDLSGNEVMIPPSTIALRTIGYNDQVAYPWFAPAGFSRGLVSNASSVGFLETDGTYKSAILNQGQRDVLYLNKINPIAYIPSRGLVIYGQKTLAAVSSATDRINVSRLINYLRFNLDIIVKPYLFEPNDNITRKAAKATVERFLSSLVGLRGLYDYVVQCDGQNNTPDRVDRNELWIDVGITPEKAVEFIYIPVRIQNTTTTSISA